jgi:endogenous inhibitor of DNA gyrase (YacG/DUF329 family)
MNCPNCQKEVIQVVGKRSKVFCNSTCRSNFWQKGERKKAKIVNLNENTGTASNKTKPAPQTNYSIDTTKNENKGLNQGARPQRLPNEDALDYAGRINEWKKLQK